MRQILQDVVNHIATQRDVGGIIKFDFRKQYSKDEGSPLRPSSAGKCARQTWYKLVHPELATPIQDRGTSGFLHGDIIHEAERALIGQVADLRCVEKKFYMDYVGDKSKLEISGSVDGIIYEDGEPYCIIDIKSTNDRSFSDMCRNGADPGYVGQLQIYMYMTGVHDAYLWLYNKNDTAYSGTTINKDVFTIAQRAVIHVPYDEDLALKYLNKLYMINIYADRRITPDRDYTFVPEIKDKKQTGRDYLPWQCSYCQFTAPCWSSLGFELVFEKGKPRWIRDRNRQATDEELLDLLGD